MIRVMSAAIIARRADRQRNILLCRRAPGTHCAGLWCTPGGKVEPGECDAEALAREVREETGVRIWSILVPIVYKHIGDMTNGGKFELFCFAVQFDVPRRIVLNLAELDDYGWFLADDLDGLGLAPADAANRDALKKLLRRGV